MYYSTFISFGLVTPDRVATRDANRKTASTASGSNKHRGEDKPREYTKHFTEEGNAASFILSAIWYLVLANQVTSLSVFFATQQNEAGFRLLLAYCVVMYQLGLYRSILGWLSWALQVILAFELPPSLVVSQSIAAIGLATIHLLRVTTDGLKL